ncbi:GAF domain-containing protein [Hymenobacter sp. BT730]|uniref:GAF domain-containing protein n=1 Tax=Hymenobacter sp. BT730 TaxID=3063332 RepID=UPI0026DF1FAE|nr:GAF domain-containing protein [Hymenobacter sp. BT730]
MLQTNTEAARLVALKRYDILDTPPDGSMNRMAALAAKVFNMPIAIISLVDEDRIWFRSHHGLDVEQIGRDPGLCASAILSDEVYLVEDARRDPRTLTNPLVAGEFGLQFYAAAPLITQEGYKLGTFCIIDRKPRYLTEPQKQVLQDMAGIIMDEIELRLAARTIQAEALRRVAELEKQLATKA